MKLEGSCYERDLFHKFKKFWRPVSSHVEHMLYFVPLLPSSQSNHHRLLNNKKIAMISSVGPEKDLTVRFYWLKISPCIRVLVQLLYWGSIIHWLLQMNNRSWIGEDVGFFESSIAAYCWLFLTSIKQNLHTSKISFTFIFLFFHIWC